MMSRAGLVLAVVAIAATGSASAAGVLVSNPPVLANIVVPIPGCEEADSARIPITWTPERVCDTVVVSVDPVGDDVPTAELETPGPDADVPADPQSDEPATPAVPLPAGDPLEGDEVGHSVGANDELSPEQSDRQADDGSVESSDAAEGGESPEGLVDDEASTVNDSESTADA